MGIKRYRYTFPPDERVPDAEADPPRVNVSGDATPLIPWFIFGSQGLELVESVTDDEIVARPVAGIRETWWRRAWRVVRRMARRG